MWMVVSKGRDPVAPKKTTYIKFKNQEPRKGGFSKGGFCRVQCHAQGNKKYPGALGPAVHLALYQKYPQHCWEFLKGFGAPSRTLKRNSRKRSESASGVFPEFFRNFLFFGCFGCFFSSCSRLFYRAPLGTLFGCFQCRAFGTSVDGRSSFGTLGLQRGCLA